MVRTSGFRPEDTGSIPVSATIKRGNQMSKMYSFDKENLINLLKNYRRYFTKQIKEKALQNSKEGKDMYDITNTEIDEKIEEFIDESMRRGEIKLETIFDEIDEVLEKTHGKSLQEVARDKFNNIN